MKKHTYRIRNGSEYNASLKKRGSGATWTSPEAFENWTTDELTGEPGASPTFTNLAIETMATVQAVYGLAGRQTQGCLQSVFELMKLDLTAPDHSTPSRRRRQLTITLPVKDWSGSRHLVIDSTGVKVYGDGEWKVRQISVPFLENLLPKAVEHFHYARQCSIIQARTISLRAIATLALGRPRRPQR